MSWTLAEFREAEALVAAIQAMRARGLRYLDAYTPYPVNEIENALALTPSNLPKVAFVGALLGASVAYGFQWWINVELYPLNVGGRPAHFALAFVPITFEMGVLLAALTGIGSIVVAARLFRLWQPIFELEQFRSATRDRYWLEIDESDPKFESAEIFKALEQLGALRLARVGKRRTT